MSFWSELTEVHAVYVADQARLQAYERALRRLVRSGDLVVDLGAGTGVLGLLAFRAGAGRVLAIEESRLLEVARRNFVANGHADRVELLRGHSRSVVVSELAHVVVCDQLGSFGVDAGIVADLAHARARLLRPDGRLVPDALELWLAPVESPRARERISAFERPLGFDLGPAREAATNAPRSCPIERSDLLADPACVARLELGHHRDTLELDSSFRVARGGELHGLGGWFASFAANEALTTNAPGARDAIRRDQTFFPVDEPVRVAAGDTIRANVRVVLPDVASWTVEVAGKTIRRSSLGALPLGAPDLARTRPDHRPRLSAVGEARRSVLELCDGLHTTAAIEAAVAARHGAAFASAAELAAFVAAVIAKDAP